MKLPWPHLKYWETGEWQVIDERLKDLSKRRILWNPGRERLFKALQLVSPDAVRVLIVGQDPYPDPEFACGLGFSTPMSDRIPKSLSVLLDEVNGDYPGGNLNGGDLTPWVNQGVLLWNAFPSCTAWLSGSHRFSEYEPLTHEIVKTCSDKGIVCAFLGGVARKFGESVNEAESYSIYAPHPAARNNLFKKSNTHLFFNINQKLRDLGQPEIDWRLP